MNGIKGDDSIAQGTLPDRLAYCFCKRSHRKEDFGLRYGDVGYGIEHLFVRERCYATALYYWRHIPKKLHYHPNPDSHTPQNKNQGFQNSPTETWTQVKEQAYYHCGTRFNQDDEGEYTCPSCVDLCPACGFGGMHAYQRYGLLRPYTKIRSMRRRCEDFVLEVRDLDGI